MTKIITLLMLLLAVTTATSQSYPYKHPEILIGKEVKGVPNDESKYLKCYKFFTTDMKYTTYMPVDKNSTETRIDAVIDKEFLVKNVIPGEAFGIKVFYIELEAADKSILYYRYDPTMSKSFFPFEVKGKLEIPDDYYCDYVQKTELSESTTYMLNAGVGLNFVKRVTATETTISLIVIKFIESDGSYGNGVALLLENDKKIAFPQLTIFPTYKDAKSYRYMHTFEFSKKDLELLKANKIVGVKFIDKVVPIDNGDQIRGVLNCLLKL